MTRSASKYYRHFNGTRILRYSEIAREELLLTTGQLVLDLFSLHATVEILLIVKVENLFSGR